MSMLDLGSGPTVHHLLPLLDLLEAVTVMDLLPENLDEISRWLHEPDTGHDWVPFAVECTEQLRSVGGLAGTDRLAPERLLLEMRRRLKVGGVVDLLSSSARGTMTWDVVSLFFVACSSSASPSDFASMVGNAFTHVRPGGVLELVHQLGAGRHAEVRPVGQRGEPDAPSIPTLPQICKCGKRMSG